MWSNWTGIELPEEFQIDYVDTFDIRDQHSELELLTRAAEGVPHDAFKHYIHDSIVNLLVEDPAQATDIKKTIAEEHMKANTAHATTTPETRTPHIQTMIMDGLTDQQMLALHPEISQADIDEAKQALLENGAESDE